MAGKLTNVEQKETGASGIGANSSKRMALVELDGTHGTRYRPSKAQKAEEDEVLCRLLDAGSTWEAVLKALPHRSKHSLVRRYTQVRQVHFARDASCLLFTAASSRVSFCSTCGKPSFGSVGNKRSHRCCVPTRPKTLPTARSLPHGNSSGRIRCKAPLTNFIRGPSKLSHGKAKQHSEPRGETTIRIRLDKNATG